MTGQRFGLLTVVKRAPNKGRRAYWLCRCTCNGETLVSRDNLRSGHARSCGCQWRAKRYPKRDLANKKFGSIRVLAFVGRRGGDSLWRCRCDCGTETVASGWNIYCGATRSCGCGIKKGLRKANVTHGKCQTTEYRIWAGMQTRCYNTKELSYQYYGARGVRICARWRGEKGFENFFADMGPRPSSEYSIDRKDVNGHYSKRNCRWATKQEQAENKRRTIRVTHAGQEMSLMRACREVDKNYYFIRGRVLRGMPFALAITMPSKRASARQ